MWRDRRRAPANAQSGAGDGVAARAVSRAGSALVERAVHIADGDRVEKDLLKRFITCHAISQFSVS